MNRRVLAAGLVLITSLALIPLSAGISEAHKDHEEKVAAKQFSYVGTNVCIDCHKKQDDRAVKVWKSSKHAKAFETLATDKAKKFSKAPQNDPKCLECHVVGFNKLGGYSLKLSDADKKRLEGVGCEGCHNPGSEFIKVMKAALKGKFDHKKAMAAGLVHTKTVCVKCHNNNSPTHKNFDVDKSWKLIEHGE